MVRFVFYKLFWTQSWPDQYLVSWDIPEDDFVWINIYYNTEIVPFTCYLDICKITNPDKNRSLLDEILLKMMGAFAICTAFVRMKRLLGRHLWQLKWFHQVVHSFDADVNAIITLKNMGDFIWFKPFVIVGIDVKNLGSNDLIFSGSDRWYWIAMIVGAVVNT